MLILWLSAAYAGTCNVAVQGGRIPDAERRIGFVTAKALLDAAGDAALDDVVCVLRANPSLPLQIAVHTDADGSPSFARRLTQTRAEAILVALTAKGIDPGRLSAVGYGGEQPIADNTTSAGRIQNRRVELWTTRPPAVAARPAPAPVVAAAPVPVPVPVAAAPVPAPVPVAAAPVPAPVPVPAAVPVPTPVPTLAAAAPPPPIDRDLELEELELEELEDLEVPTRPPPAPVDPSELDLDDLDDLPELEDP